MIELCCGRFGVSRALLNAFPPSHHHSFLHPQNFRIGFVRVHCACDTVLTLRRGGGQQRVFNSIFEIVFMLTTHSPPGGPAARRSPLSLPISSSSAKRRRRRGVFRAHALLRPSVRPSVRPWVFEHRGRRGRTMAAARAEGGQSPPPPSLRLAPIATVRPSARCLTKIHHDYVPWRKAGNKRCNSHSTALHRIQHEHDAQIAPSSLF